jgi:hypothetical protein
LPAAALAVHQLRYYLAFGGHTNRVLAAQGHAYLGAVVPAVVLICAAMLGCFIARVGRAWGSGAGQHQPRASFISVWALSAVVLVVVYCGQEFLEGLLSGGHPVGLAGIIGHGGWVSIPLSVALGAVIAYCVHGARTAVTVVAAAGRRPRFSLPPVAPGRHPTYTAVSRPRSPLASLAAGRAPPRIA